MKSWYASKTIWLNVLAAVLASLEASTGALRSVLPEQSYVMFIVGLSVANVVLRTITTEGIGKADV